MCVCTCNTSLSMALLGAARFRPGLLRNKKSSVLADAPQQVVKVTFCETNSLPHLTLLREIERFVFSLVMAEVG